MSDNETIKQQDQLIAELQAENARLQTEADGWKETTAAIDVKLQEYIAQANALEEKTAHWGKAITDQIELIKRSTQAAHEWRMTSYALIKKIHQVGFVLDPEFPISDSMSLPPNIANTQLIRPVTLPPGRRAD